MAEYNSTDYKEEVRKFQYKNVEDACKALKVGQLALLKHNKSIEGNLYLPPEQVKTKGIIKNIKPFEYVTIFNGKENVNVDFCSYNDIISSIYVKGKDGKVKEVYSNFKVNGRTKVKEGQLDLYREAILGVPAPETTYENNVKASNLYKDLANY